MQHRSVAAASRTLGVTPSAVSHALARLRRTLGDELFIATNSSMMPTRRALEIAPNVREGLGWINSAISANPSVSVEKRRIFNLAVADEAAATATRHLVEPITQATVWMDLQIVPMDRIEVLRCLETGQIDLAFGSFDTLPNSVRRKTVTEAVWHQRADADGGVQWLVSELIQNLRD